jgi:solute carrier family 10 (sodium/bile acid cotransporter), member 7
LDWWKRNGFLLGLIVVLVVGTTAWQPLQPVASQAWLRSAIVALVLLSMSLGVSTKAMWQAIRNPSAVLLALLVSVLVVPLLAKMVSLLLPSGLAAGLIVASAVPCTMASATVWTRRAGGDDAVAVLVMMITNFGCFAIIPYTLWMLLGTESIDWKPGGLVIQLLCVAMLPMAIGQLLRRSTSVARWADRHAKALTNVCQIGILTMVLFAAAQSAAAISASAEPDARSPMAIAIAILAAVAVHAIALTIAWGLARLFGQSRPQQIAIALSGSQKTLMLGLEITTSLGASLLPMVAFHVGQLILDGFLVGRWKRLGSKEPLA